LKTAQQAMKGSMGSEGRDERKPFLVEEKKPEGED
jgi:hypothetical protein